MKSLLSLLAIAVALAAIAPASAAVVPSRPTKPTPSVSTYDCGDDMGYLRRVYEEQIEGIENASIVPICENDDYGLMRSEGNAGAIREELADNAEVIDALDAANFGVDDVVGVRMTGDETAVIYVHTFHYR